MIIGGASVDVQYILDSISYGSLFALMALWLALLFGVMGLMNFAYGELIMVGAYMMFYTRSWGWLAMVVIDGRSSSGRCSLLMELVAFRPLAATPRRWRCWSARSRSATGSEATRLDDRRRRWHRQKGVAPYPWLTNQFDVSGVLISKLEIITIVVTIAPARRDDPAPEADDRSASSSAPRPRISGWRSSSACGRTG